MNRKVYILCSPLITLQSSGLDKIKNTYYQPISYNVRDFITMSTIDNKFINQYIVPETEQFIKHLEETDTEINIIQTWGMYQESIHTIDVYCTAHNIELFLVFHDVAKKSLSFNRYVKNIKKLTNKVGKDFSIKNDDHIAAFINYIHQHITKSMSFIYHCDHQELKHIIFAKS